MLGPDSVLLMGASEDDAEFFRRLEEQKRFGIAIRKAPNQRIAGAAYLRSLLRWWPLSTVEVQVFDQDMWKAASPMDLYIEHVRVLAK